LNEKKHEYYLYCDSFSEKNYQIHLLLEIIAKIKKVFLKIQVISEKNNPNLLLRIG